MFSDDDVLPLDQYVFNTEAHAISARGYGKREDTSRLLPVPGSKARIKEGQEEAKLNDYTYSLQYKGRPRVVGEVLL